MGTDWEDLAGWWIEEVVGDPAYVDEVLPLSIELLDPQAGAVYLDAGCGEGRVMQAVGRAGATMIGCDLNPELLLRARGEGPVVACRLPELDWIRPASLDGVHASLVVEHLADLDRFFAAAAKAVIAGGRLVVVVNHPLYTAPDSGPILDPTDGEVFWRWGTYLEPGSTDEPAGEATVTFHHRPLAVLLNSAAESGWALDRMVELGVAPDTSDRLLAPQAHIPRLLGCRWIKASPAPH